MVIGDFSKWKFWFPTGDSTIVILLGGINTPSTLADKLFCIIYTVHFWGRTFFCFLRPLLTTYKNQNEINFVFVSVVNPGKFNGIANEISFQFCWAPKISEIEIQFRRNPVFSKIEINRVTEFVSPVFTTLRTKFSFPPFHFQTKQVE